MGPGEQAFGAEDAGRWKNAFKDLNGGICGGLLCNQEKKVEIAVTWRTQLGVQDSEHEVVTNWRNTFKSLPIKGISEEQLAEVAGHWRTKFNSLGIQIAEDKGEKQLAALAGRWFTVLRESTGVNDDVGAYKKYAERALEWRNEFKDIVRGGTSELDLAEQAGKWKMAFVGDNPETIKQWYDAFNDIRVVQQSKHPAEVAKEWKTEFSRWEKIHWTTTNFSVPIDIRKWYDKFAVFGPEEAADWNNSARRYTLSEKKFVNKRIEYAFRMKTVMGLYKGEKSVSQMVAMAGSWWSIFHFLEHDGYSGGDIFPQLFDNSKLVHIGWSGLVNAENIVRNVLSRIIIRCVVLSVDPNAAKDHDAFRDECLTEAIRNDYLAHSSPPMNILVECLKEGITTNIDALAKSPMLDFKRIETQCSSKDLLDAYKAGAPSEFQSSWLSEVWKNALNLGNNQSDSLIVVARNWRTKFISLGIKGITTEKQLAELAGHWRTAFKSLEIEEISEEQLAELAGHWRTSSTFGSLEIEERQLAELAGKWIAVLRESMDGSVVGAYKYTEVAGEWRETFKSRLPEGTAELNLAEEAGKWKAELKLSRSEHEVAGKSYTTFSGSIKPSKERGGLHPAQVARIWREEMKSKSRVEFYPKDSEVKELYDAFNSIVVEDGGEEEEEQQQRVAEIYLPISRSKTLPTMSLCPEQQQRRIAEIAAEWKVKLEKRRKISAHDVRKWYDKFGKIKRGVEEAEAWSLEFAQKKYTAKLKSVDDEVQYALGMRGVMILHSPEDDDTEEVTEGNLKKSFDKMIAIARNWLDLDLLWDESLVIFKQVFDGLPPSDNWSEFEKTHEEFQRILTQVLIMHHAQQQGR